MSDALAEQTRTFRGISRRLAAHYLQNLGGELLDADTPAEATEVEGDGWRVSLSAETVEVGPSLTLTEVTVAFSGNPDRLDGLVDDFAQKAMRAGG
jgi:hypothetical protein